MQLESHVFRLASLHWPLTKPRGPWSFASAAPCVSRLASSVANERVAPTDTNVDTVDTNAG
jgi:hypothetical protein